MHKTIRDIELILQRAGVEPIAVGYNGSGHIKVDVRAPNGRQRPFTFPTGGFDRGRRMQNYEMQVRHWRREVCPEADQQVELPLVPQKAQPKPPPKPQTAMAAAIERALQQQQSPPPPPTQQLRPVPQPEEKPTMNTNASNASSRTCHKLTRKQFRDLTEWVKGRAPFTHHVFKTQLAAEATEALGFPVNTGTITEVLELESITIPKPPARLVHQAAGSANAPLVVLARELVRLLEGLKEAPSPELLALAGEQPARTLAAVG